MVDNQKSLVSIIIPCFNAELFITQALDSVCNQSYKNWEVIIINDGSTDKTEEIISNFKNKDSRIKYYRQDNAGVSAARNEGIRKSTGDIIAFLDADDAWEEANLLTKVDYLNNGKDLKWVYSDMYLCDEHMTKTAVYEGGDAKDLLKSLLLRTGEVIHAPSNIVVFSDFIKKNNIYFDLNLSTSADWDFCIQLAAHDGRAGWIPKSLWQYRILTNSMSRNLRKIEKDNIYVQKKASKNNLYASFAFKRLCFSNNYLILAGSWWVQGENKLRAIYFIILSFIYYPSNSLKLIKKLKNFNFYQAKKKEINEESSMINYYINKNNRTRVESKISTFLFHRVNTIHDPLWNPIHPHQFEKIIDYLDKNFQIINLEEHILQNDKHKGKKPLCTISFDDGYKDYLEYALPILHKKKLPSSMYVVTDCVEKDLPPWTYLLNHCFNTTKLKKLEIDTSLLSENLSKTKWSSLEDRIRFGKNLNPYLKSVSNQMRIEIVDIIMSQMSDVELPTGLMMNWEEIQSLASNNCLVGSHSASHPVLTSKLSQTELAYEMNEPKRLLELHTGIKPISISYPFGRCNNEVKMAAQEAGYKCGVGVNPTSYNNYEHDIYNIPRIEMYNESFFKSQLRISEVMPIIKKFIK